MQSTADRDELTPPRDRHWRGPLSLALIAHGLLMAALTWGIRWNTHQPQVAVQAELWSTLPQVAAPPLVAPEPVEVEPPAAPAPPPPPAPKARPATPPPPKPEPQAQAKLHDAQIALKKQAEEKQRHEDELEQRRLAEEKKQREVKKQREREEAKKREEDKQREQAKKEEAARKKHEAEQAEARKKKEAEAAKEKARLDKTEKDKADKAKAEKERAEQQKKQDAARKADEARQHAQLEADRQKNLQRMMGMAGATGGANAKGSDKQTSGPGGPSANYAGKLVAAVRPNIVFPDEVSGNPKAEVEVRTFPDGTIAGSKLIKSSGNKAWDDAVLRAVERTNRLPRDVDGRVPSTLILEFRPKD